MGGTATEPLLELDFLSHGTVLMDDLDIARRFYEEFLGLEVVKTSQISLAIRLNSDTSVACVAPAKRCASRGVSISDITISGYAWVMRPTSPGRANSRWSTRPAMKCAISATSRKSTAGSVF